MAFHPFGNGATSFKMVATTPNRVNGSVAEVEPELSVLYHKYEQFREYDLEKDKFISELLTRIEFLTQQYERLSVERMRDQEFVSTWQLEKQNYEKWFENCQGMLDQNPFVMVLIDGDGMIFADDFIHHGEAGGRRAASQLHAAVEQYIREDAKNIPIYSRIVCRIYANVTGLGEVLVRKGLIEEVGAFEDFVRGFSRGKILFDFIDVGTGKDRADEKIIESMKLFSQDLHCRCVLFGCSHDNGYARALEECADRPEVVGKVVLLEGVPFEKELVPLPYTTKKFPGLFRDAKIVLSGAPSAYNYAPITNHTETPPPGPKSYSMVPGLPTRFPAPDRPTGLMDSPLPSNAVLANAFPRTPSSSTLASDGALVVKPVANTWAAKAAAPPPPSSANASPVYRPARREEQVSRNRSGQRVDPPCKEFDKTEVDRVKKMKLCNVHFLRRECPYNSACTHDHSAHPTEAEIATLRLVARMAPCTNGSGCQDTRCIYGHRCPAPPHRSYHVTGTKSCIFGEACKFPPDLHDIDTHVVKTLVVR